MADKFLDLIASEAKLAAQAFKEEADVMAAVGLPERSERLLDLSDRWFFMAQSCEGETSPYGIPLEPETQEVPKAKE